MASSELQVPRRPVISVAVDCTCSRKACAPFDGDAAEDTRAADPVYFKVIRKSLSQLCVVSQVLQVTLQHLVREQQPRHTVRKLMD